MKGFSIILLLFIFTRVHAQETEITISGDTLTLRAMNIASDPFSLGTNPLNVLMKLNPQTSFELFENRHVENKTDTVFTLVVEQDTFKIYKLDEADNGLLKAAVSSSKFKTRHGLQVGMTKKEVTKKLHKWGLNSVPGILILEEYEFYELLILNFKGEVLSKIGFQGYFD